MPVDVGPSRWAIPDPPAHPGPDADPAGIVGFGADLAPATLVDAYRRGIFPWPHDGVALPWFSPDPRAILRPDGMRVTRSLRQRLRRSGWTTTVDAAFDEVIAACAAPRESDGGGTWIDIGMVDAYRVLHRLGWARSLEVWDGDHLVGGLYGVQLGGVFTGESMFHRATDASKVALVDLCHRFGAAGGALIDVQLPTEHLASMGAIEVPRREFLAILRRERDRDVEMDVARAEVSRLVR